MIVMRISGCENVRRSMAISRCHVSHVRINGHEMSCDSHVRISGYEKMSCERINGYEYMSCESHVRISGCEKTVNSLRLHRAKSTGGCN